MRVAARNDIQVVLRQSCAQGLLKSVAYVVQLPRFVDSMCMVACAPQGARPFCSHCRRDSGCRCHFLSRDEASWSTVHVIYSWKSQLTPSPHLKVEARVAKKVFSKSASRTLQL